MTTAVEIINLSISYRRRQRLLPVIKGVSLTIAPGTAYGLVGESGCGKTTIAMALMRYLPPSGVIDGGSIRFFGEDLLNADASTLRRWRGNHMAMVYQDPGSSLNPAIKIGRQLAEPFLYHQPMAFAEAWKAGESMLEKVQLAGARAIMERYPHELSGGQQQRVMIAMALANNPKLLVLDEPTTGLDATVEAEVLDLIERLRLEYRTAILFISHNLGIVGRMCERIGVLYAGHLVEEAPASALLAEPRHPYTVALLRCYPRRRMREDGIRLNPIPGALPSLGAVITGCPFAPRCPIARPRCDSDLPPLEPVVELHSARCFYSEEVSSIEPPHTTPVRLQMSVSESELLTVSHLRKRYRVANSTVTAVDDVSLTIAPGEVFGLVGESGSGKSTLAKCILGLAAPSGGEIRFAGEVIEPLRFRRKIDLSRKLQIVFQNPDTSLNPTRRVRQILGRAVRLLWPVAVGEPQEKRIVDLSTSVRLAPFHLDQWPKALSGGLKQRVAIARAFAGRPLLVVCDEPVSALDVSVQAAILNLFLDLQREQRVAYLFISHDLGVVRYLSDRIGVMYLGQLVEIGTATSVFDKPHHPYTEALLSAAVDLDQRVERVKMRGPAGNPAHPPTGCRFHPRCHRYLGDVCRDLPPPWHARQEGSRYRCHIPPQEYSQLPPL